MENREQESHHKNHSMQELSKNPFQTKNMFELFLLLGIPPDSDKSDPNVLIAFPPFCLPEIQISNVVHFCLPTGTKRTDLACDENRIIQDEFVFQVSVKGENLYGVCVHVHLTKNQKKSKRKWPFFISKHNENSIFCFCLLSKIPAFGVHFMFLTYLGLAAFGKVSVNNNCKKDDLQVMLSIGEPINGLDLNGHIGFHPSIKLPEYFELEIEKYYQMPLTESQTIVFHKNFELYFPLEMSLNGKSILYASLDTLFS